MRKPIYRIGQNVIIRISRREGGIVATVGRVEQADFVEPTEVTFFHRGMWSYVISTPSHGTYRVEECYIVRSV